MKTNTIITIGRQYGSAGREIGYKIAEDFGIKLYDKEMLARAAKESGICEEIFETHDEKPTNSFLYSLVMDTYSMGYAGSAYNDMPLNHKVVSVFIHADLEARISRISRIYDLPANKAKDRIVKTDKKRASYYNYYTNKRWGDADSYELCLNSSKLGIEGTAKAIEEYVLFKEGISDKQI